jgi:hypothetical protein
MASIAPANLSWLGKNLRMIIVCPKIDNRGQHESAVHEEWFEHSLRMRYRIPCIVEGRSVERQISAGQGAYRRQCKFPANKG